MSREGITKAAAVAMLLSLSIGSGCSTAKRDASALADAVDRFRNANDTSREAQAAALSAVACSDERVCDAKRSCVEAAGPTTRALALKDEVGRKVADVEAARLAPDSPEVQALPLKLDEASRLLREGHEKMDQCDAKLTDLRATYGF